MNTGIIFCLLGALSFGLLGCASKGAERRNCQTAAFIVMVYVWALLVMLIRTVAGPTHISLPLKAVAVAIGCGACSAIAYYAFQFSIGFGKVAVGWLMMNVSAAIPAIVSLFVYGEKLTRLKIFAFGLAAVSLGFIYLGRRAEMPQESSKLSGAQQTKWLLLMLVILATNGMSAYGLKVIAAWGLPEAAKFPYLTVWYAAGLATVGVPTLLQRVRIARREAFWGGIIAALSMGGQIAMAVALKLNVPGHIVFPISMGGSVLIVTLGGRFIFGERLSRLTTGGVSVGLAAIVLLSIS
jgi:drug/metabolite transporter (DMT)-like permease